MNKNLIQIHRLLALCILTILCYGQLSAQIDNLKSGKLHNGLSYYIVQDKSFKDEVHFYLYQNVGAILEDDNENGLAHYLEHMAFNSTEHFPDGVMNFLRRNGIYTFDARTGTNQTQYAIYNVPTKDKSLTNSMLMILKDWCNGLSLKSKDMEKERNIIIEEWRQRNNINKRLSDAISFPIYNNSKYAYRNTIGTEELIRNFSVKDIRKFYNKWYKPNLQCVAIIGDIDPNTCEQKVKEIFGKIPNPKNPPKRINIPIEDNKNPIYYRFVDKENTNNSLGIYQRIKLDNNRSQEEKTRDNLLEMIFNKLSSRRLAMLRNEGIEDFIGASVSYSSLVRMYAQNAWDIVPYAGRAKESLKQILSVRESIRRKGFSENEFDDVKKKVYENMKGILESENLGTPDNYMETFKQNYLYNKPLMSFKEQLTASVEQLVELEAEDLYEWIQSWMNDKNLAFITYSTNPKDMNIPLAEFEKILSEVKEAPIMTFQAPKNIDNIVDFNIEPGKITSTKSLKSINAEEWQLSNGARVLYKHIPNMREGIFFVGSAMGGHSLIADKDQASYQAMESLIMQSGVYKYNRNELYKWLSDKQLDLNLNITDYTDGLGGSASLKDAENFFKYLYLVLNRQNFDKNIFKKYVEREKYLYKTRNTSDMTLAQDSIIDILYPPTTSNPKKDLSFYNKMQYADLPRLFNERFGNASDFTFCLVGAMNKDEARNLVEKYIASLKGIPSDKKRSYKIINNSSPQKEIAKDFIVDDNGNLGEVEISYINDKELSIREQKALIILEGIMQNKCFEELREKSGGTYSVGVRSNYKEIPTPILSLNIHFRTESSKVDELKQKAYKIIENIAKGDFSKDEFKNVYVIKVLDEQQANEKMKNNDNDQNPFKWLAILNTYSEKGTLPEDNPKDEVKMESITAKDVTAVLNKILDNAKHRDIVIKSTPPKDRKWVH